jgi:hypothetical protein
MNVSLSSFKNDWQNLVACVIESSAKFHCLEKIPLPEVYDPPGRASRVQQIFAGEVREDYFLVIGRWSCLDLRLAGAFTGSMRSVVTLVALGFLALAGCAHKRSGESAAGAAWSSPAPAPAADPLRQKLIITPETGLVGKVIKMNASGRFVVLNFPIGHLPARDQRLNVYRLGLKVGEVQVTEWQRDDNVVADIVAGAARVGDEARDH